MWAALMWGGISGSAVLIGALAALVFSIKKKVIGNIMAFGTGVLIGAAAYELLGESSENGGLVVTSIGFLVGAGVFTVLNLVFSKKGAGKRKRSLSQYSDQGAGIAIFIGTVMDAIPESVMIGASLLVGQGVSFLLVVAIFISNFPEGLSSTTGLVKSGYSKRHIVILWLSVVMISAFSSWAGYAFLSNASDGTLAWIAAFAGGGIIAMVGSTMMPEAHEEGGTFVGLMTSLGLLTSLILDYFS